MTASLTVDIVASDRVLWSGMAESVVVPAIEGEIGLLRNHEPILSVLKQGKVRVRGGEAGDQSFDVTGGFISFDHDNVTIVVDTAETDSED